MNDLVKYSEKTFEDIKHTNEYGEEFWYARELQLTLEYSEWRNFNNAIEKAKTACETSGFDVQDHFVGVNKMVKSALVQSAKSMTSCFPVMLAI